MVLSFGRDEFEVVGYFVIALLHI